MKSAKFFKMGSIKEYIEVLEQQFGGLRKAGKALGIDWQRLQYYKKSGEKLQKFLDFLEVSRIKTKKSKGVIWDTLITKKPEAKTHKKESI